MYAALLGTLEAAKVLLESGADVEIKNDKGQTAEDVALAYSHPEIAALLQNVRQQS